MFLGSMKGRENRSQNFDENEGFDMPQRLQNKIIEMGDQLNTHELGTIAHSLHKMYISIGPKNSEVALIFTKVRAS
jgi:hypothetical protein